MDAAPPLLDLDRICIDVPTADGGWQRVVDRLSLRVVEGERLALVGESGSGKSLTALAAIGLVPDPAVVREGRASVAGIDLARAAPIELRRLRGATVGFLPQEPSGWLNPVLSIGFQLVETIRCHRDLSRSQARQVAAGLLEAVALPHPETMLPAFPHQLSGGEGQRAALALALAGEPRLLIADEPTTALDVTTQAQILALIAAVSDDRGLALLLISHDLEVVAGVVDRVVVIYAGEIVEEAPAGALFERPLHPYTRLLLEAGAAGADLGREDRPSMIEAAAAVGCRFAPRCPSARSGCATAFPELHSIGDGRLLRCPVVTAEESAS